MTQPSLLVEVEEVDGVFVATAPWLSKPVTSTKDANEAFAEALDSRVRRAA